MRSYRKDFSTQQALKILLIKIDMKVREKSPNTKLFLVRIFLCSVQIQENTDQK